MVTVKKMWEPGFIINCSNIITVATGIIIANDRSLRRECWNKIGEKKMWIDLNPVLILEIGLTFSNEISEIVQAEEIPT